MRSLLLLVSLSCFSSIAEAFLLSSNRPSQSFASRIPLKSAASTLAQDATDKETLASAGNVIFLLPSNGKDKTVGSQFGRRSPVDPPCLADAAAHLVCKTTWFSDGLVKATTTTIDTSDSNELLQANALIALGLSFESDIKFAQDIFEARRQHDFSLRKRQCQFGVQCSQNLPATVGPYDAENPSLASKYLPWTTDASGRRLHPLMLSLFERWTSDDFTVALMLFFNLFSGQPIDWVKHSIDATWEKGPIQNAKEAYEMATKCGDCIQACLADETCKSCLDALNQVDTRDQVASYRVIVSYESELLRDFSQCILQKNNVFHCDATIPTMPKVTPISKWRGKPLTKETAQQIFIAHLNDEGAPEGGQKIDTSWRVAAGANVAYDQFPSQHQIFYQGVSGKDMWYDPVFRVQTIDGRNVWCKRHYKVRNGPTPGTFRFSVLDNGVTSNEFWTIAGVADDLSWAVFHYAGAASAVGQRYIGGLLCTPDGTLPPKKDQEEIWKVLRGAGIQPWELFVVDNSKTCPGVLEAGPPPLTYFLDGVRAAKAKRKAVAQ